MFKIALTHTTLDTARTMVLTSLVVFEWLIAFNSRSDEASVFKLGFFKNRWFLVAVVVALSLQLAVLYLPFLNPLFKTAPLTLQEWGYAALPGLTIFCIESLRKVLFPKLFSSGKYAPPS